MRSPPRAASRAAAPRWPESLGRRTPKASRPCRGRVIAISRELPFPCAPMWADRLCHTGPENSGDEALARRLLGRGGPRLRANLRHDLRYAYGTRLCALRRRHPIYEFLAVRERESVEAGAQFRGRQRIRQIGGDHHGPRSSVDLERNPRATAGNELRGFADLLPGGQVVPASVDGDRRAVFHAVQRY